jgi:hypothetical protein
MQALSKNLAVGVLVRLGCTALALPSPATRRISVLIASTSPALSNLGRYRVAGGPDAQSDDEVTHEQAYYSTNPRSETDGRQLE